MINYKRIEDIGPKGRPRKEVYMIPEELRLMLQEMVDWYGAYNIVARMLGYMSKSSLTAILSKRTTSIHKIRFNRFEVEINKYIVERDTQTQTDGFVVYKNYNHKINHPVFIEIQSYSKQLYDYYSEYLGREIKLKVHHKIITENILTDIKYCNINELSRLEIEMNACMIYSEAIKLFKPNEKVILFKFGKHSSGTFNYI